MKQFSRICVSLLALAAAMPVVSTAASADENLMGNSTMSDKELDTYRGGSGITFMDANLQALFENNTCTNCTSGANNISDSFNNINGMTNVILNSGNNVVIQSSFQVNVNFGQ